MIALRGLKLRLLCLHQAVVEVDLEVPLAWKFVLLIAATPAIALRGPMEARLPYQCQAVVEVDLEVPLAWAMLLFFAPRSRSQPALEMPFRCCLGSSGLTCLPATWLMRVLSNTSRYQVRIIEDYMVRCRRLRSG